MDVDRQRRYVSPMRTGATHHSSVGTAASTALSLVTPATGPIRSQPDAIVTDHVDHVQLGQPVQEVAAVTGGSVRRAPGSAGRRLIYGGIPVEGFLVVPDAEYPTRITAPSSSPCLPAPSPGLKIREGPCRVDFARTRRVAAYDSATVSFGPCQWPGPSCSVKPEMVPCRSRQRRTMTTPRFSLPAASLVRSSRVRSSSQGEVTP
jgi:hypothetical protein